ncbi:MAG TPA: IPT/TIG domain-containing protein, partial [Gammaproteobacteria bacterium]
TGVTVPVDISVDSNDARRVLVTPTASLNANAEYRIVLKGVIGSRRSEGLFDHVVQFATAPDNAPLPVLGAVTPTVVSTGGGTISVDVANAVTPDFLVAGKPASIVSTETVDATTTRYHVSAPANLAGPAQLQVINKNGASDARDGALQYVEPLVLNGASPAQGNINGGTTVTITGAGFRPGLSRVSVAFGGIPAAADSIKVLDANTITVVSPEGRIGKADITVTLDNGESATLPNAFEYLQPIQSDIAAGGKIYDTVLDPTETYLVTAAGSEGVRIYNVDASTYTGDPQHPLNADDLRHLIDENGDGVDDRLLAQVALPDGYLALGVATYFEHGEDRVFVTAAKPGANGTTGTDGAKLFIIGFDSDNIKRATVIDQLPLPGNFARGIRVLNDRALVAMGNGGVGLVDASIQTKTYLMSQLVLPDAQTALDVADVPTGADSPAEYAAVSGHIDLVGNRLRDAGDPASGGFYLLQSGANGGLQIVGSLPIPASRVVVAGHYAYLACGSDGLVIVDIEDPQHPNVVSRLTGIGTVYDVDISGTTLYLAMGGAGVRTVDVTDPLHPHLTAGMEATPGTTVDVIVAGSYGAYGTGATATGSVVQVTPDVTMKVSGIDPGDGILDQDAQGNLTVTLHFNKAIDLAPDNLHRFAILDNAGNALPVKTTIVNNDAILQITDASSLQPGEKLTVVANAGIESVKPLPNGQQIVLYTLAQTQRFELTFRGDRADALSLESVVPRRVPQNKPAEITIAGQGIPSDPSRIQVYVGGIAAHVSAVTPSTQEAGALIVTVEVPGLQSAGLFDITLQAETDGVWQSAVLHGALAVDAPVKFDHLSPQWGPITGGTTITITGSGFQPGNTVEDGLQIRIGSLPVAGIKVLSSTTLQAVTLSGTPGLHDVVGQDQYGNTTTLTGNDGFGYGLKLLVSHRASDAFPTDLYIDPQTGVAITNGGYVYDGHGTHMIQGLPFPETLRAATFDIQDPINPILVGGVSSLPSGSDGQTLLSEYVEKATLEGKQSHGGTLTASEQKRLDELSNVQLEMPIDSIRLDPANERIGGVTHKRLFVANGSGGVAQLNADDENGLQVINALPTNDGGDDVTDVLKWGDTAFAVHATGMQDPNTDLQDPCQHAAGPVGSTGVVHRISYYDAADPVDMGVLPGVTGSNALARDGDWLYSGGQRGKYEWLTELACALFDANTANRPGDTASGDVTAVDLYDPELTRDYAVAGNVFDINAYGPYLIVALGSGGVEIFNKNQPDQKVIVPLDQTLMAHAGRAVRLRRFGNLLFVSAAGGGLVVLDISNPLSPRVVSAGNMENIEAADVYKGRVVTVAGLSGLSTFDMPGAFVTDSSIQEGELITDSDTLTLTFDEPVTEASIEASDAVTVTQGGSTTPV